MRVCDICKKSKTVYRLYEESYVDLKTEDSGDLTEVGEFCRDCLELIYGYIRCLSCARPQAEVIQINHTKTAEIPPYIDEKLRKEMEKGFF